MGTDPLTEFSGQANTIADGYRRAFAEHKIGGCTIDMTVPDGSTEGGRLALQHISFHLADGLRLVVGTANARDKRAELRGFGYVARVHEDRFGKQPPFTKSEYEGFLAKSRPLLAALGLVVSDIDDAIAEAPTVAGRADKELDDATARSRWRWFLVASIVLFVGVALLVVLR